MKLAQVADMELFRTYGLLWPSERAPNSGDPLPLFWVNLMHDNGLCHA